MFCRRFFQSIVVMCACAAGWLHGYASVGREAPNFQVKDFNGQECSLSEYKGKIVVLEWTNPKCPYVKKHYSKSTNDGVGNMQAMQKHYTQPSIGVVWIMVASAPEDSSGYVNSEGWKAQLQQWGASPSTLIIDSSGELADLYGAQRTPEVMVIGKNGVLLYRGAVDSLRGTDPSEVEQYANLPWLKNALENAVQDRRVIPPETIPYGCPARL
jgi:hypothetical protein